MIDLEFYEQLKNTIEGEKFREILIDNNKTSSLKYNRKFLILSIYFLISTRNFNNFDYFIDHIYNEKFPYHYLSEVKGLNSTEIEKEFYNNFIQNGYLFHTTRKSNVNQILDRGLLTLNDRYKCDVYQQCLELDKIYQSLKNKNQSNPNSIFSLRTLINVPGENEFKEDRFNTIYLSSNLEYILDTYGEIGEFSNLFLDDIGAAFNGYYDTKLEGKTQKINMLLSSIKENNIDISDDELCFILNFIEKFSEETKGMEYDKAILMIPNSSLNNPNQTFKMLYQNNKLNLNVEDIIDFNEGEIVHKGSIPSQEIIAITPEEDHTYKVKIKGDLWKKI